MSPDEAPIPVPGESLFMPFLKTLLDNPHHSDVTLIASDSTTFHAHLLILRLFTDFFDAAETRTVNLPQYSRYAVNALLEYCYTGVYQVPIGAQSWPLDVYQLADHVSVEPLKDATAGVVESMYDRFLESVETVKEMPECWDGIRFDLSGIVVRVYEVTDCGDGYGNIRRVVVETARRMLLLGFPGERLEKAVREDGDFAVDLFRCMEKWRKGGGVEAVSPGL